MMTLRFAAGILCALLLNHANAQTNPSPVMTTTNVVATNAPAVVVCKTLQRAMAGKHQHIVAYGTSLTWGTSWVEKLRCALYCEKAKYNFTISNVGQNSQTSDWGLGWLDERVLKRSPDAVLIEFGINDAWEGSKITLEQSRKNLETMIDRILQKTPDCDIILMTMNSADGAAAKIRPQLEAFYQIYRDVAKERGLVLVDMYPTWKELQQDDPDMYKSYVPDGVHTGPLGDSNVIVPAILEAMGFTTPEAKLKWLEEQVKAFRTSVAELDNRKITLDEESQGQIKWIAAEIEKAWAGKQYLRLYHLLNSFRARKVRRILEDKKLQAYLAVPQKYADDCAPRTRVA